MATLQEALPTVFGFFSQAVETGWGNEPVMAAATVAVKDWATCDHSGLTLPVLASSFGPVYHLLFQLISTGHSLAAQATAALISAISSTPLADMENPACFVEIAGAVLRCRTLYEKGLASRDEEACAQFVQLLVALAARCVKILLQGRGGEAGSAVLQALVVAIQHPTMIVADLSLEFWLKLSEVWPSFSDAIRLGEVRIHSTHFLSFSNTMAG